MRNSSNNYRKNARFAGVIYLLCMVASIGGGLLIRGVIDETDIVKTILDEKWRLIAGTTLELINGFSLIGIAAAFWVPLKGKMPATAIGYLSLRSIEAALCIVTAFIPVFMIQLAGQAYSDVSLFTNMLIMARDFYWAYVYVVIFFISGLLFYIMLYKTAMVPQYIAVWGLVALLGVLTALLVPSVKFIAGLLIIANEVYLGTYLIVKGFRTSETKKA